MESMTMSNATLVAAFNACGREIVRLQEELEISSLAVERARNRHSDALDTIRLQESAITDLENRFAAQAAEIEQLQAQLRPQLNSADVGDAGGRAC
jgi:uncharacterized small protein (DUF1192 family)